MTLESVGKTHGKCKQIFQSYISPHVVIAPCPPCPVVVVVGQHKYTIQQNQQQQVSTMRPSPLVTSAVYTVLMQCLVLIGPRQIFPFSPRGGARGDGRPDGTVDSMSVVSVVPTKTGVRARYAIKAYIPGHFPACFFSSINTVAGNDAQ